MSTTLTEISVAPRTTPTALATRWDALDVLRGLGEKCVTWRPAPPLAVLGLLRRWILKL